MRTIARVSGINYSDLVLISAVHVPWEYYNVTYTLFHIKALKALSVLLLLHLSGRVTRFKQNRFRSLLIFTGCHSEFYSSYAFEVRILSVYVYFKCLIAEWQDLDYHLHQE